ncbi:MAG TPA: phosphonate C-P lyase system protein PhnH [Ferrovibrio sp.]|uniref:phosphonate C-P lyase system protein PhnH n=1 Tax=Ferrovibrio sp. TaxID=1917215 RepID=UPI002ED30956
MAGSNLAPVAGFDDPVQQSQQSFRALLDATARPGRMTRIEAEPGRPDGIGPALAAAALTLCDFETPVWLGPGLDRPQIRDWLRFHTGAPFAEAKAAAFALLDAAQPLPPLEQFSLGCDEAPDRGATLLIQVGSLQGAPALTWRGPGIRSETAMPFCGLPEYFWHQRAALPAVFPRGLDIYLCCGSVLVGLPRSTAIAMEA